MSQFNQRKPANWVRKFELEGGHTLEVSEKGHLRFTPKDGHPIMFSKSGIDAIVQAQVDIMEYLTSDDYKSILEDKERNKVRQYEASQNAKLAQKAALNLQASIEALQRAGIDPATALAAVLKPAAKAE